MPNANLTKEAKISKVEITEYTPDEIDQLIRFIYLGSKSPDSWRHFHLCRPSLSSLSSLSLFSHFFTAISLPSSPPFLSTYPNKRYTEVNFQPFEKAHTILHNCARLWILGDYFNVQALCDEVMDYLTNKVVPRNGRLAEAQGFSLNPQDWLDAGRCIYTEYEKKHKLKDAFLAITLDKIFVRKQAINMPEYMKLCREYNQFGTDAMLKLIKDGTTRLQ